MKNKLKSFTVRDAIKNDAAHLVASPLGGKLRAGVGRRTQAVQRHLHPTTDAIVDCLVTAHPVRVGVALVGGVGGVS